MYYMTLCSVWTVLWRHSDLSPCLINPQHACAVRVTVVGFVSRSVKQHLTSRMNNCAKNEHAYSLAYEHEKILRGFFLKQLRS